MFDLVTDVADYPNFLPWCGGVEVGRHDEHSMEAKIHINFKGIKQHFATRNVHTRPTTIDMEFMDGPFKKFTGYWRVTPLRAHACQIAFALPYKISYIILYKIIRPGFCYFSHSFVGSF